MRKIEELEAMFKEIGLGTEQERDAFLKFVPREHEEPVAKEQMIIRLGTSSKPQEDNGNA
jgi:hypothetical protein